jgi:hypothetical protein
MTGINNVDILKAIVHKVGNPTRNEELKLSAFPLTLNDELVKSLLTKYFLSPFNENEHYHFTHISDLAMNEVYTYVRELFDDPAIFTEISQKIAAFLYSQSTHVRVKEVNYTSFCLRVLCLITNRIRRLESLKAKIKKPF